MEVEASLGHIVVPVSKPSRSRMLHRSGKLERASVCLVEVLRAEGSHRQVLQLKASIPLSMLTGTVVSLSSCSSGPDTSSFLLLKWALCYTESSQELLFLGRNRK